MGAWAGRSWNGATLLAAWVTPTPEERCVKAPFVTFRVGAITTVAPPAGSVTHAVCLGAFIVSLLSVNKQGKCFICRFLPLGTVGNGVDRKLWQMDHQGLWLFSPFSTGVTRLSVGLANEGHHLNKLEHGRRHCNRFYLPDVHAFCYGRVALNTAVVMSQLLRT